MPDERISEVLDKRLDLVMAKARMSYKHSRSFNHWLHKSRAMPAIVLVTSLVIVTASFEVGIRLAMPQNLNGYWLQPVPDGLIINKPGGMARHQLGEVVVRYRFNRFGQRAENSDLDACRRALVLGDSITFGWLLEREQSFVGLLQERLNERRDQCPWRLLNASVGGWGTADQLLYLERFGPQIRPSAVIVFISFDDIERSHRRGFYRLGKQSETLTFHPATPNTGGLRALARRLPGYQWLLEHSHLFQFIRNAVVMARGVHHANISQPAENEMPRTENAKPRNGSINLDKNSRLASALFSRMADWCRRNKAQLIVLTNGWPTIKYGWIDTVMAKSEIAFADLRPLISPVVKADPDSYRFRGDMHPNAKAAALIAEAAWPFIDQKLQRD